MPNTLETSILQGNGVRESLDNAFKQALYDVWWIGNVGLFLIRRNRESCFEYGFE